MFFLQFTLQVDYETQQNFSKIHQGKLKNVNATKQILGSKKYI